MNIKTYTYCALISISSAFASHLNETPLPTHAMMNEYTHHTLPLFFEKKLETLNLDGHTFSSLTIEQLQALPDAVFNELVIHILVLSNMSTDELKEMAAQDNIIDFDMQDMPQQGTNLLVFIHSYRSIIPALNEFIARMIPTMSSQEYLEFEKEMQEEEGIITPLHPLEKITRDPECLFHNDNEHLRRALWMQGPSRA